MSTVRDSVKKTELRKFLTTQNNILQINKITNSNIENIQKELFGGPVFVINPTNTSSNVNNVNIKTINVRQLKNITNTLFKRVLGDLGISQRVSGVDVVLDTHLDILNNLQSNLNNIDKINTDEVAIPEYIKNLYKKYLKYLIKIIIVKIWKDLKILELFGLVFHIIIPKIVNNLNVFGKKVSGLQNKLLQELRSTTQEDKIADFANQIKNKINSCIHKIAAQIQKFIDKLNPQSGGAETKIQYNVFTSLDKLNEHIESLKKNKKAFEDALQANINQFDLLCDALLKLLDNIFNETEDITEELTPYIKITGLKDDVTQLREKNKGLLDLLINTINGQQVKNLANKNSDFKDFMMEQKDAFKAAQPATTVSISSTTESASNSIF